MPELPHQGHRLVEVNAAAFPIVVMRVPVALDGPAIRSMFDGMDHVLERQARFALIVDTRALKRFPTAVERSSIAEWMKARSFAEARFNLGNAVVLSSPAARAVLTAIQWIRRPITAHGYMATMNEAIDWCCERLAEADVPAPSGLSALRNAG